MKFTCPIFLRGTMKASQQSRDVMLCFGVDVDSYRSAVSLLVCCSRRRQCKATSSVRIPDLRAEAETDYPLRAFRQAVGANDTFRKAETGERRLAVVQHCFRKLVFYFPSQEHYTCKNMRSLTEGTIEVGMTILLFGISFKLVLINLRKPKHLRRNAPIGLC